ncbi:hypothetical protein [Alicycliphilus denitrificans]|uniref:hypothetical protein n=1 Tax=Alicycliphilus denitrificans TaxID=179636 RepID=UPI0001DA054A|nr:hypothetical protein [Alicycliphilus denitrificans]ADU99402.1 hypothetical protein Alide_1646 [Alicycliphilus denitrificans BC]
MTVRWIPTTDEVYSAIRRTHHQHMQVHGTITDLGEFSGCERIMTEWGLPGADYPLVKVDSKDGIASYWIAVITKDEEA